MLSAALRIDSADGSNPDYSALPSTGMRALVLLASLASTCAANTGSGTRSAISSEAHSTAAVQVVLFGPYSNLATKYLWQSLFNLHLDLGLGRLQVLAASRDAAEIGMGKVRHIIATNVTCSDVDDATACQYVKQRFLEASVTYHAIANEQGYAAFGNALTDSEGKEESPSRLLSRILYMSVAPDVVEGILHRLAEWGNVVLSDESRVACPRCRVLHVPSKVLLEKPVGRDEASATQLLRGIGAFVSSSDLYITDHYMAKAGLLAAAGLRAALHRSLGADPQADALVLHSEALARRLFTGLPASVLAAMLEAEDAAGRTSFYNDYGVIRDVMQNHVSLLALATLGGDAESWTPAGRLHSLRGWAPASRSAAVFGHDAQLPPSAAAGLQALVAVGSYAGYDAHVTAEKTPAVRDAVAAAARTAEAEQALACSQARLALDEVESAAISALSALSAAASVRKQAYQAARGGRSPAPRELFGEGFAGPTAASVALEVRHRAGDKDVEAEAGSAGLLMVVGKALGVRSAFVRHCIRTPSLHAVEVDAAGRMIDPGTTLDERTNGCPLSVTYHLQGRVMLPASGIRGPSSTCGSESRAKRECTQPASASLNGYTGPAIIVSAQEPDVRRLLPALAEVLTRAIQNASAVPQWAMWLASWHIVEVDVEIGLLVLRPPLSAATALATTPQSHELMDRLAAIGRTPGASSVDAYTMIMAAGLAHQAQTFVSPSEVEQLWTVWGPVADAADVLIAAQTTNSTLLAHAGACDAGLKQLGGFHAYAPGERAWLLTEQQASVLP